MALRDGRPAAVPAAHVSPSPHSASDAASETFGIRTITTRLIGASPIAPQGSRQFLVNGRPFVFRGGGWSEDLFLRYSAANTANQIAMIKNLGLNGIRTEGKQMPDNFYEQFDRAGLLVDAGYQCCDAWQLQDSKLTTPHDYALLRLSARAIGMNLRNHPSILNFSWSDNQPTAEQEAVSVAGFRAADFQEPLIASAEYKSSPKLGPSGEKEGPYDWVPPSYWYDTTHYRPQRIRRGPTSAVRGRLTARRAPATPCRRWTRSRASCPRSSRPSCGPTPTTTSTTPTTSRTSPTRRPTAATRSAPCTTSTRAISAPLRAVEQSGQLRAGGPGPELRDPARAVRGLHRSLHPRQAPSTGVVYWQLNKGWPTLLWDLYNHDLDQAGSYFGAKKANEALHVLYAYDTGAVAVDNLGPRGPRACRCARGCTTRRPPAHARARRST